MGQSLEMRLASILEAIERIELALVYRKAALKYLTGYTYTVGEDITPKEPEPLKLTTDSLTPEEDNLDEGDDDWGDDFEGE